MSGTALAFARVIPCPITSSKELSTCHSRTWAAADIVGRRPTDSLECLARAADETESDLKRHLRDVPAGRGQEVLRLAGAQAHELRFQHHPVAPPEQRYGVVEVGRIAAKWVVD